MTNKANTILKTLQDIASNTDNDFTPTHDGFLCAATDKPYYGGDHKDEFHSILDYLEDKKYIRFRGEKFHLTHKGLNPKAVLWDEFKEFLLKSVVVPIVIAFITAVLTLRFR